MAENTPRPYTISDLLRVMARLRDDDVTQLDRSLDGPVATLNDHYGVTAAMYLALRRGPALIGLQSASHRGGPQRFTPNLWDPPAGDQGTHGVLDDRSHGRSLQLWGTQHRPLVIAAGAALVAGAAALLVRR